MKWDKGKITDLLMITVLVIAMALLAMVFSS